MTIYSNESKTVVETLFFDKIFNLLMQTDDKEKDVKDNSFRILQNLIHQEEHRLHLANKDYLKKVYEAYKTDRQVSERISWLTTLICFYPDMIQEIIRLNLLDYIIKICG